MQLKQSVNKQKFNIYNPFYLLSTPVKKLVDNIINNSTWNRRSGVYRNLSVQNHDA